MKLKTWRKFVSILAITAALSGMVLIFSTSAASVPLSFIGARYDNIGLNRAISVAISPDGEYVYVASEVEDALAVFSRDAASGVLTPFQVVRDGGAVNGLNGAWGVTVSPDGNHVYVAGRFDNAVAVFSRNIYTGALNFIEAEVDGEGVVDGLSNAVSVAISPDGNYAYVAGWGSDAIAYFSRNTTSGTLTYIDRIKDGEPPVDGLGGVWSVAISPDGKHLYAASGNDNAVAVFSRNIATGVLSYVERKKDGEGGLDGLGKANSVSVSPDGKHVYATGRDDHVR